MYFIEQISPSFVTPNTILPQFCFLVFDFLSLRATKSYKLIRQINRNSMKRSFIENRIWWITLKLERFVCEMILIQIISTRSNVLHQITNVNNPFNVSITFADQHSTVRINLCSMVVFSFCFFFKLIKSASLFNKPSALLFTNNKHWFIQIKDKSRFELLAHVTSTSLDGGGDRMALCARPLIMTSMNLNAHTLKRAPNYNKSLGHDTIRSTDAAPAVQL